MSPKPSLFPLTAFLLVCLAFALIARLPIDWSPWRAATCMPAGCFCEQVRAGETVRQPSNAWSSLTFALTGLVVAGVAWRDRSRNVPAGPRNPMAGSWFYPLAFAASAIVIGLGSAFYHASLTFTGQFFDVFGMYLLTTLMLAYALRRLFRLSDAVTIPGYLLLNVPLTWLLVTLPEFRRSAFAVVLIVALALEIIVWRRWRPDIRKELFGGGFLLFASAYAVWILDNTRILCSPASLLQGHALWHILGAAATWLLFLYYRSEEAS
jgi:hypothetical protein